jgi:protein-S-isoprenylcysteine O-methyltransferase Ste14
VSSLAVAEQPRRWRWALSTSLVAAFWFAFFAAHLKAWTTTHRPVGLGAVSLELVFAVLFLLRRRPLAVSRAPIAWLAAPVGSFGMLAGRPHYAPIGTHWLPLALQLGGSATAVLCLLTLGRSFGIVAANRGLRTSGPYRIVRHPIYACYAIVAVGYVLENPTRWNAFVAVAVIGAQLLRIREEERCLLADSAYRRYCEQVRHRLVPFVY